MRRIKGCHSRHYEDAEPPVIRTLHGKLREHHHEEDLTYYVPKGRLKSLDIRGPVIESGTRAQAPSAKRSLNERDSVGNSKMTFRVDQNQNIASSWESGSANEPVGGNKCGIIIR